MHGAHDLETIEAHQQYDSDSPLPAPLHGGQACPLLPPALHALCLLKELPALCPPHTCLREPAVWPSVYV